jgi:hypothetical protein
LRGWSRPPGTWRTCMVRSSPQMPASSNGVKLLEPHVDHAGTDGRKSCQRKKESSNSGSERVGRLPKSCGNCSVHVPMSIWVVLYASRIVKCCKIKGVCSCGDCCVEKAFPALKSCWILARLGLGEQPTLGRPTPTRRSPSPTRPPATSIYFDFSASLGTLEGVVIYILSLAPVSASSSLVHRALGLRSPIHNNTTHANRQSASRALLPSSAHMQEKLVCD